MKSLRRTTAGPVAILCLVPLLLAAPALTANQDPAPKEGQVTAAAARAAITEQYEAWGRARVELDRQTLDSILAPDFHVLLYGRKVSREQFLNDISRERLGARLTRFDADILTVQQAEAGWTVVIREKLEITMMGSGGKPHKACSLWVTRDGWRQTGDKWVVTYSEAIGHENWTPGTKPPISDW